MFLKGTNKTVIFLVIIIIEVCTAKGEYRYELQNVTNLLSAVYTQGAKENFTQLAGNYKYVTEEHTVITEDGYILSVFRIPKGKNCQGPVYQPPVLVMHGLLQSADSWLDAGPSAGHVFLLSDACYDVWAGNVRGTYYGRKHVRLDPDKDAEFWDFSTDEMGRLDLPATIDYILNTTGSTQLSYIGFSQGGRIFFIMCSETSGYCEKIKVSINLAPACRPVYSRSLIIRLFTIFLTVVEPLLSTPRELEILQRGGLIQTTLASICQDFFLANTFCKAVLFAIDSVDLGSFTTQTIKVLFGHFPGGISVRTGAVYGQNALQFKFQKYDYGISRNLEIYGSIRPPIYNVSRANAPVVLIYGKNDFLVDPKDVKWLANQLPNIVELYQVTNPSWTHFDNCYSRSTKRWIFPKINEYLQKYSQRL